ncbi:MAG: hypothetical protein Q7U97_17890, partial [Rhodocyclaceae bacterium]|nr:hypothetical protein [Rhodocyclaceae bacterium]
VLDAGGGGTTTGAGGNGTSTQPTSEFYLSLPPICIVAVCVCMIITATLHFLYRDVTPTNE